MLLKIRLLTIWFWCTKRKLLISFFRWFPLFLAGFLICSKSNNQLPCLIHTSNDITTSRANSRVNTLRQSLYGYYDVEEFNLWCWLGMDKIREDRHQSQTSHDMITSCATSRVNSRVNKLWQSLYSYYDVENCNLRYLLGIKKFFTRNLTQFG